MTLTLLIDLDDTLLVNPMSSFIPTYLSRLGAHISQHVDPDFMIKTMLNATQAMFENEDFTRTLKDVFDEDFYPVLGVTEEQVKPDIDIFYKEQFPGIKEVTSQNADALRMVKEAEERGYTIGIATNPLFPETAIQQRLDWAGLTNPNQRFALVPSYESFHFAKPNPAFYAEFLARIGWPRETFIMVGNDLDHDIKSADAFGIPSFWATDQVENIPENPPQNSGPISSFMNWLDASGINDLKIEYKTQSAILAIMKGIPAALQTMLANIPDDQWTIKPSPNEWSLTEVVCHLRDVEKKVNLPRINLILENENAFIPGIDTDQWAKEFDYNTQSGQNAFREYIAARQETISILSNLSEEGWKKPSRHAIFGPTNLLELASIMAGHDRLHVAQIFTLLN